MFVTTSGNSKIIQNKHMPTQNSLDFSCYQIGKTKFIRYSN